jgi:hypothetical protein
MSSGREAVGIWVCVLCLRITKCGDMANPAFDLIGRGGVGGFGASPGQRTRRSPRPRAPRRGRTRGSQVGRRARGGGRGRPGIAQGASSGGVGSPPTWWTAARAPTPPADGTAPRAGQHLGGARREKERNGPGPNFGALLGSTPPSPPHPFLSAPTSGAGGRLRGGQGPVGGAPPPHTPPHPNAGSRDAACVRGSREPRAVRLPLLPLQTINSFELWSTYADCSMGPFPPPPFFLGSTVSHRSNSPLLRRGFGMFGEGGVGHPYPLSDRQLSSTVSPHSPPSPPTRIAGTRGMRISRRCVFLRAVQSFTPHGPTQASIRHAPGRVVFLPAPSQLFCKLLIIRHTIPCRNRHSSVW